VTAGPEHWFEELADHMGSAYDRYAHTKGTEQEVDHLVGTVGLRAGDRVLDVGCGTGRHAWALGRRGIGVHGVDISRRFVEVARRRSSTEQDGVTTPPTFERMDARSMPFTAEFDAVVCLCQGAFGMMTAGDDDEAVVAGMARALRPGGRLALSAFNAYFVARYHDAADLDADAGVAHETTEIRSEVGELRRVDLWTGCYTPRELRLLLRAHGLRVTSISGVEPGRYGAAAPSVESPELLVIADRS
jgi:SAM-dependent methyltransferase